MSDIYETVHAVSDEFKRNQYTVLSELVQLSNGVGTVDDVMGSILQMSETLANVSHTLGVLHTERVRLSYVLRSKLYSLTDEQITDILNDAFKACLDAHTERSNLIVQYRLDVMNKAIATCRESIRKVHNEVTEKPKTTAFTRALILVAGWLRNRWAA